VSQYHFTTLWHFDHPLDLVWEEIRLMDRWPEWWPYVRAVKKIKNGDEQEIGSIRRIHWSTALPYSLKFDSELTRLEYPKRMEGRAFGDLTGTGIWTFDPNGQGTTVRYDWNVIIEKKWLNMLEPILKPLYKWNHDKVMAAGYTGLAKRLAHH
jgi:hypothetical protein